MWVYVYGLMAYLPACTVPEERGAGTARWWHWLMAIFLPLFFIIPLVVWLIWRTIVLGWSWISRKTSSSPESGTPQGDL
jgi:hypothetical protein